MLFSLKQILNNDPSVGITINIPIGYCAYRETINDKWIIKSYEEENDK